MRKCRWSTPSAFRSRSLEFLLPLTHPTALDRAHMQMRSGARARVEKRNLRDKDRRDVRRAFPMIPKVSLSRTPTHENPEQTQGCRYFSPGSERTTRPCVFADFIVVLIYIYTLSTSSILWMAAFLYIHVVFRCLFLEKRFSMRTRCFTDRCRYREQRGPFDAF